MLYKQYQLFNNQIEIMLPSDYIFTENAKNMSRYCFASVDGNVEINVNIGGFALNGQDISLRLQDYYIRYKAMMKNFVCRQVIKRNIYGASFGQMLFDTKEYGMDFSFCLLIGNLEGKEVVFNFSCLTSQREELDHVMNNIFDSIRIKRKGGVSDGD